MATRRAQFEPCRVIETSAEEKEALLARIAASKGRSPNRERIGVSTNAPIRDTSPSSVATATQAAINSVEAENTPLTEYFEYYIDQKEAFIAFLKSLNPRDTFRADIFSNNDPQTYTFSRYQHFLTGRLIVFILDENGREQELNFIAGYGPVLQSI
jgi:hypothetical protein